MTTKTAITQRIQLTLKTVTKYSYEAGVISTYLTVLRAFREKTTSDMVLYLKKHSKTCEKAFKDIGDPFSAGALHASKEVAAELGVLSKMSEPE